METLNWELRLGLVNRVTTFSTRCLKLDSSNLWYLENMWSAQRSDSLLLSPSSCSRSSHSGCDIWFNIRSLGAERPRRSRETWPLALRVSRILRISNIIKLSRWLSISTNLASWCHLWHYVCKCKYQYLMFPQTRDKTNKPVISATSFGSHYF